MKRILTFMFRADAKTHFITSKDYNGKEIELVEMIKSMYEYVARSGLRLTPTEFCVIWSDSIDERNEISQGFLKEWNSKIEHKGIIICE